ncbi:MAG: C4-dicarboxylate ABC transporter permease [Desulfobacterales bacterium CG07_land_8_20_14_0_80_52_14]|nr:MAG: C4-dicarboxylate ABC transporter permease [Desulfobacterales bacterium CG23_combo_of_CG06-09_8_20_14_all_52_9]PIU49669.1 MAG: C4-dicarboxylate ABC transporter permease [Desulfobacterales bacterium CG07_land_8_20_14_0_80_52_14]
MQDELDSCPQPAKPNTRVPLKIEETLAGIAIGLLALITFANVVVRYATNFSFAFTEEFSVFLMLFMAFVGASSVMAKNGHLNITYFVDRFRQRLRRWIRLFASGAAAVTFAILAVLGGWMAFDEYRFEVTSPGLGIPTWIYTVWMPILCLGILGRTIGLMMRLWKEKT